MNIIAKLQYLGAFVGLMISNKFWLLLG